MIKIEELRNETYQETKILLKKYHKCAIVRPTGFGKTGILTRLIKDYKKVLYLYPADIIWNSVLNFYYKDEFEKKDTIDNVINWTYQMLTVVDKEKLDYLKDVDLVIADECHRIGGVKTRLALKYLMQNVCTKADLCGATATPERMDLVDEITEFFDNHITSSYSLHDAYEDGVIQRPYYCYCSVNYKKDFDKIKTMTNKEIEKLDDINDKLKQRHKLNEHLIEISKLVRMPNIIRTTCDECIKNTTYMKFIVFCADLEHINKSYDEVKRWFTDAYPNHNIRTLIVSSENEKTKENINHLKDLTHEENTIDLIYSCNMLNMGYHIDDLTGIVMYRMTSSNIIYAQQLGRINNSGISKHGVVFDVVDNLHRKSLYDLIGEESEETKEERCLLKNYTKRINETGTEKYEYGDLSENEIEEYLFLKDKYENKRKRRYCELSQNDLIVTGFSATYQELIEKTMAEPISMRCRQTYEYWVRAGGKTTGIYSGIAGVLLQEKKAREINYGYCNNKESTVVPITPFAKIKKVSVEKVLEVIFGKEKTKEYQTAIAEVMSNTLPRVREEI